MNAVEKADRMLKDVVFILVVGAIIVFCVNQAFGEPVITKVDEFNAKVVVSNVSEKEGTKTTVSQERNFSLEEVTRASEATDTALKSWQDEKVKCDENIAIQEKQKALWKSIKDEMILQGVQEKPIEEPK